ncbi:MAG: U32 family peptidase [Firmicutes bacterium]|nr:U32 family peptidase [Bacillota bacterium]
MAQKLELLAPAGNMEKAKVAIAFGADAIYVGGKEYSLRASAGNFTLDELSSLVEYAHNAQVKVYVAVNSLMHNEELAGLPKYLRALQKIGADAVIFADPAVYSIAKDAAPDLALHISTQASVTNWRTVQFWESAGIQRVILARELSLREIKEIRARVDVELETFVHGAMCISYSGRCLLSNYMTGRDANRGQCAQSCRWRYALVEEKRPGHYYPIMEDAQGTYILNSKDLNMLAHIPAMAGAGIGSLKIEGRMKSVYYVGVVVKAYRAAIDAFHADPVGYQVQEDWLDELDKVSHRPYTTGFYFGPPGPKGQFYESGGYIRQYDFVGILPENGSGKAKIAVRNRIRQHDKLELVTPTGCFEFAVETIWDGDGVVLSEAHANQEVYIKLPHEAPIFSMVRRKKD